MADKGIVAPTSSSTGLETSTAAPSGTRYFVLTSVSMERPFPVVTPMDDYRHDHLGDSPDLEYFHCYRDGKRPYVT